jgi:hypothetical protein
MELNQTHTFFNCVPDFMHVAVVVVVVVVVVAMNGSLRTAIWEAK